MVFFNTWVWQVGLLIATAGKLLWQRRRVLQPLVGVVWRRRDHGQPGNSFCLEKDDPPHLSVWLYHMGNWDTRFGIRSATSHLFSQVF